jgi:hypothetical protein
MEADVMLGKWGRSLVELFRGPKPPPPEPARPEEVYRKGSYFVTRVGL